MNQSKTKVAIIFGGRSPEHQISLLSAQNVLRSLDRTKYEPILIGIDKQGTWHLSDDSLSLINKEDPNNIALGHLDAPVLFSQNTGDKILVSKSTAEVLTGIDVIFPVLHGTYGEDGSIQGLAKLANIPCVGCGILGSAVGMDKDIMKHVLRSCNIGIADWVTVRNSSEGVNYTEVTQKLGNELFIKPANLGSSVGVSYSDNEKSFFVALDKALQYDPKVIIEEKITGREIECAVLGNHEPIASIPGEVSVSGGFYSYENKYLNEKGAELHIPAELDKSQIEAVHQLALDTYTVLECRGMSRVDMFLLPSNELIINEVNTIPGFTNISMYPKLWEISGIPQNELITRLIELAQEEHIRANELLLI